MYNGIWYDISWYIWWSPQQQLKVKFHQGSPPVHQRLTGVTSARLGHCATWYDTMSESLSLPLQSAASQVLKNLDLEACPESCFPGNLMLKWRIPQREVQCLAAVRRLMPLRKFSLWRGTTTAFTLHLSMQGSWKALICQKSWKELKFKKKNMSRVKSQSLPKTFGEKKQPTCPTTLGSINLPRTLFCEVIQLTLMPAIRIVPQQPSNKSHVIIWVDKVAVILLMLNHDMS